MEIRPYTRNILVATGAVLGALSLVGCGPSDFSPAQSVTHDADPSSGSTREIQDSFPGASQIKVIEANNNPNYMSWMLPNGSKCTAIASAVSHRDATPGSLITVPYCR